MSDEQDKLKVSLEPPKLFGRKRKSRGGGADEAGKTGETATAATAAEAPDPVGADRAEQPSAVLQDRSEADAAPPVVEPEPAPEPAPEPGPAVEPEPEPAPAPERQQVAATKPVRKATPATVTAAAPPTTSAPVREAVSTAPARRPAPGPVAVEPEPVTDFTREDAEIAAAARADREPLLDRYPAAALTGGIVGLAAVSLIWLFLRGCEAARGTSSCGGGPGLVLLLLTFAACVLLGTALLRTFMVSEPGTTSFLACGVVAAISLTFLVDLLDSWPIMVIVPLLAVASYLGSVKLSDLIDESADTT